MLDVNTVTYDCTATQRRKSGKFVYFDFFINHRNIVYNNGPQHTPGSEGHVRGACPRGCRLPGGAASQGMPPPRGRAVKENGDKCTR